MDVDEKRRSDQIHISDCERELVCVSVGQREVKGSSDFIVKRD